VLGALGMGDRWALHQQWELVRTGERRRVSVRRGSVGGPARGRHLAISDETHLRNRPVSRSGGARCCWGRSEAPTRGAVHAAIIFQARQGPTGRISPGSTARASAGVCHQTARRARRFEQRLAPPGKPPARAELEEDAGQRRIPTAAPPRNGTRTPYRVAIGRAANDIPRMVWAECPRRRPRVGWRALRYLVLSWPWWGGGRALGAGRTKAKGDSPARLRDAPSLSSEGATPAAIGCSNSRKRSSKERSSTAEGSRDKRATARVVGLAGDGHAGWGGGMTLGQRSAVWAGKRTSTPELRTRSFAVRHGRHQANVKGSFHHTRSSMTGKAALLHIGSTGRVSL